MSGDENERIVTADDLADFMGQKVAAWVPMTEHAIDDFGAVLDRVFRPWRYPDDPTWPTFVPLPALERARCAVLVARERIRDAWSVLLGRETLSDDRSDW